MLILPDSTLRVAQAVSGLVPSKKWLDKGLEIVFLGDQVVWSKTAGALALSKVGTPKLQMTKFGRFPGFGTTYGTGTTDRLDGGILPRPATGWRSWVAHYYANGTGGGGFGRICQDTGGGGSVIDGIICSSGMSYLVFASGTSGQWSTGSFSTGRWQSFGGTHDQRTVNVVPTLYLDGTSVSVTTVTNASGTYRTTPCNLGWGNRASDGIRGWDGLIGPVLIFDGPLTADDQSALDRNPLQVFDTPELELWVQSSGTTITCTVGNAAAAGVTANVNTSIVCTVGNANAAGVTANLNIAIPAAVGNASAAGITATISAGGNVTITCTVGNADAAGPSALISTTVQCSVGNAVAAGITALIQSGVVISASVGNAVASGITAAINLSIKASVGNASAAGITAVISGAGGMVSDARYTIRHEPLDTAITMPQRTMTVYAH